MASCLFGGALWRIELRWTDSAIMAWYRTAIITKYWMVKKFNVYESILSSTHSVHFMQLNLKKKSFTYSAMIVMVSIKFNYLYLLFYTFFCFLKCSSLIFVLKRDVKLQLTAFKKCKKSTKKYGSYSPRWSGSFNCLWTTVSAIKEIRPGLVRSSIFWSSIFSAPEIIII